ncbi:hypothetical protein [Streptomyces sp. SID10815]|uniref:hypothetical protein n=1 Tax=Streptomyces sp. SID10815 TaxID=2706027 RepID=UPI0013CC52FC|nr:hypothetical protein [Streptomyces sp. SID10815]NEA50483.1 hypothetical protein [Streptomyces sp. SID10815]
MNRTPASIQRRRNLANAASGFPERSRVVLYAHITDTTDPALLLAELRAFAEARDWDCSEEHHYFDIGLAGSTRRERPGWFEVSRLLREGEVDGVVAPSESHIVNSPSEQGEFRAWLATIQRFTGYLHESEHEAAAPPGDAGAER